MSSTSAVNQGGEAHLSISDNDLTTITESCETLIIRQKISVQKIISIFSKIKGYNFFCKQIVNCCNQILHDTVTTSNTILTVCNSIKPKDVYMVVDHDDATKGSTSTGQSNPLTLEMITKAIEASQIFKNSLPPSNLQLPVATKPKLTMATSKTELPIHVTTSKSVLKVSKPELPTVTSNTSLPKATKEPKIPIATSNLELPIATSQQKLSIAASQEKVSIATSGSIKPAQRTSTKTVTDEAISNIGLPQNYATANIPDFNLLQCNLRPKRKRNKELSESLPPLVNTSPSVPLLSNDTVCKTVPPTSSNTVCTSVKSQILETSGQLPMATSSVCFTGDTSDVSLTSSDAMCKGVTLLSSETVCKGATLPSSDTVSKGVPLLSSDTECTILKTSSVSVPINNSVQLASVDDVIYRDVSLPSSDIIYRDVSLPSSDTVCNDVSVISDDTMCQTNGTSSQSSLIEIRIENDLDLTALGGEGNIVLVLHGDESLEFNDVTNLYKESQPPVVCIDAKDQPPVVCIDAKDLFDNLKTADNSAYEEIIITPNNSRKTNEIILYNCDLCPKSFESKAGLLRHNKSHVRYKCDLCPKTFDHKAFLLRHNKSHENKAARLVRKQNQTFICETCGKIFKKLDRLRDHKLIHLDHKPVACPYCDYRCVKKNYMKSHLIKHVGERIHQCEECGKCFNRIETLRSHSFIHQFPEKHFACNMCPKRFLQRSALYNHKSEMHRESKRFSCMVCGQVFKRKDAVNSHMRRHTGEKPFACETCGKKYRHKSAKYAHSKKCDGKEEEEESLDDSEEED
ncbi:zinc finger protein 333 [Patella vulgata]|uniref:zinc finger protein 333 n=1 Tax=Patella vulgata TaxID=6465 RepID=UPI00217F2ED7|nr:zinc finger protein 333 [Patella vulgata]